MSTSTTMNLPRLVGRIWHISIRRFNTKGSSPSTASASAEIKPEANELTDPPLEKWQKKSTSYSVEPDPVHTCMTYEEFRQHVRDTMIPVRHEYEKYDTLPKNEWRGVFQAVGQKGGINYETLNTIRTLFGAEGTSRMALFQDSKHQVMIDDQKFKKERVAALGPDLAAAHFAIYRGARVRFHGNDKWYVKDEYDNCELPSKLDESWKLKEIDASKMTLYHIGIDNFSNCEQVDTLTLRGNKHINDFFIDRFCHHFSDSLHSLDISDCHGLGMGGLTALVRFRNLKQLNVRGLDIPHLHLACLSLEEELPSLKISGVNYDEARSGCRQMESEEENNLHKSLKLQNLRQK